MISDEAVRLGAIVMADLPSIDAPKLPAPCWDGSVRAIIEAAFPLLANASPWKPIDAAAHEAASDDCDPVIIGWWSLDGEWQWVRAHWTGEEWDASGWEISHCTPTHWLQPRDLLPPPKPTVLERRPHGGEVMVREDITPNMIVAARAAFFGEWHRKYPHSDVPIWLLINEDVFASAILAAMTSHIREGGK